MKFLLKTLVVLVTIVIVAIVSALIVIPRERSFTQETEINASRETIWKVLTDREKYGEWQDSVAKIEIVDADNWKETTKDGQEIEFTFTAREEPANLRLEYKIGDGFSGTWKGDLRRMAPKKTIIRTTDTTEVHSAVVKLMMAMFFDIEDFAKDWNQKLKKRAEALEEN